MKKKNNETLQLAIILTIVILIITSIFFVTKTIELMYYNENALINKALDKKWYIFIEEGHYEYIEFKSDRSINYEYLDDLENDGPFKDCSIILYSSKNDEFKVKCSNMVKKVRIISIDEDDLNIEIDGKKYKYTTNI